VLTTASCKFFIVRIIIAPTANIKGFTASTRYGNHPTSPYPSASGYPNTSSALAATATANNTTYPNANFSLKKKKAKSTTKKAWQDSVIPTIDAEKY